jgi:hypothetical protein
MKTITVTVPLTAHKAYCLSALLGALAALERPTGYSVRFLVVVGGELPPAAEEQLAAFDAAHRPEGTRRKVRLVDLDRGAAVTEWDGHPYRCSLVAAELRERGRKLLARRKDAYVLWVDADVIPPADALPRLLAHGRGVTSGLVLNRTTGTAICGMERLDPATGFAIGTDHTARAGAQEVGWAGMGLLLVRGDLAREISFAPYLFGEAPLHTGEDGYFCVVAAERTGELVLLDGDVSPWHVDEFGLAVKACWADGVLIRALRLVGEGGPERCCLVPRFDGYSHRLGALTAGRPHWTDAAGAELPEGEIRELAASSRFLDLVEAGPGSQPADTGGIQGMGPKGR